MRGEWHGRVEEGDGCADCGIHLHPNRHVRKHTHTHTNARTHTHTHLKPHVLTWLRRCFPFFGNSNSKIFVMKQALRLCRTGCGRCVSTARSIFVKKKKQLAHLKEDAACVRAKRNRLHTELARLSSERNRLSSERNDLRAELANLQQQQKDPTERLRKRFKTVVDHAFVKCSNACLLYTSPSPRDS